MCQWRIHYNSRQPDAAQSLSALISLTISSPMPSLNSLSLSVAVLELFYCSYVTLRCDLELSPRDLDLWPLTLNICSSLRSNSVRNLSEIGQSAAELLQFEYLTLWPWPLTFDGPAVPWSTFVRNLSAIEWTAAKLLQFEYLTLWPWTRITCSAMMWDSFHKV